MNRVTTYMSLLKHFLRRHLYLSITVASLAAVLFGGVMVFALKDNQETHAPVAVKGASTTSDDKANVTSTTPATTSTEQAATSPVQPTAAKHTIKSNTGTQPASPASRKQLKISPASVTIKAGESFSGLTVQTDDNRAVERPIFRTHVNGLINNLQAAPARPMWTGAIGTAQFAKPGTYTIEVIAQVDRNTFYTGTLTVTILPIPMMTISVRQADYMPEEDVMVFVVHATRQEGYSQPIERIFGIDTSHSLECASEPLDADTYVMACGHTSGGRPTAGTLMVNVFTPSNVFSGSAGFNLPAR